MGRSRGGLTTKIHALVDAKGRPVALKLTPGQAHDGRSAFDMLDRLGEGDILLADSAYDSNALRQAIEERGAWACIKPMPGRLDPPAFSAFLYRHRHLVERFFNKLKHFRAVATRYEKYADNYLALVKLAAVRIWLRSYESVSWCSNFSWRSQGRAAPLRFLPGLRDRRWSPAGCSLPRLRSCASWRGEFCPSASLADA